MKVCIDEKTAAVAGSSNCEWKAWLRNTRDVAKVRRRDLGTGLRRAQRRPELAEGINRDCIGKAMSISVAIAERFKYHLLS